MKDYDLAQHTPQEYYDLAEEKYHQAIKIIKDLTFCAKRLDESVSEDIALRKFDCILQCILVCTAVADGEFHRLERQFIDMLTENGDVLAMLSAKTGLNLGWDEMEDLSQNSLHKVAFLVKEATAEYADDFIQEFAKIDALDGRRNYIEELHDLLKGIVACLTCVDRKIYQEEVDTGESEINNILLQKWKLKKYVIKGILNDSLTSNEDDGYYIEDESPLDGVYYNIYRGDRSSFVKFYPSYRGSSEGEFTDVITDETEMDDDSDETRNAYTVYGNKVNLKKWYMSEGTEYTIWGDYLVPEEYLYNEYIPEKDLFSATIIDTYKMMNFSEDGSILIVYRNPEDETRRLGIGTYTRNNELIKIVETDDEGQRRTFIYLVYKNHLTDSAKIKKAAYHKILSL